MKWIVISLALVAVIPVHADTSSEQLDVWREITFTAPIPCAIVCPYWVDDANTDLNGNGEDDVSFQRCGDPDGTGDELDAYGLPFEEGTVYDDVIAGPSPSGARVLIFEIYPEQDWDSFICSMNGEEVGSPPLLPPGDCGGPVPNALPVGCPERIVALVEQGVEYRLRAYNWSDPAPLRGRYCFSTGPSCEASG